MRRRSCFHPSLLLLGGILALIPFGRTAAAELPVIDVGIVVDGPWERNDYVRDLTRQELQVLTDGEFDVRFLDRHYLTGDWSLQAAVDNIHRLLEDPEVDLVIAWGVLASHSICCLVGVTKPVIAPVILDISLQGVPFEDGASGVPNLSYVALPDTTAEELARFQSIFPFRRVAILAQQAILEAIPDLETRTRLSLEGLDVESQYIPVGFEAAPALAAIEAGTEAVFMYPQIQLSAEERSKLIDGLIERRLLSFTALGEEFIEAGFLAGIGAADFFPRMARRIALNAQRILLGEEAGAIPVEISLRQELLINMKTARALGVYPTYEALLEARLIDSEDIPQGRTLTLAEAVQEAVAVNLDLLARERAVLAGEQDVRRADSIFRPRLEIAALGLAIDEDRAAASFGSQPEKSLSGSAGLRQLIFSDDALANRSIQASLQRGRLAGYEILRLDIALEAGTTYLNLLRAKSLLQVQRNNVALTRSNLDLAEIRRSIGAANPAEVFRWESQLASDRKDLVEAEANVRVAEMAVNRILDRPLDERFGTEEVDLRNPWRVTGDPRIAGYIETPDRFGAFQDFLAEEGVADAPELKALRAAIAAQQRLVVNTRRSYWAPLIAADASLDEFLSESGAGSETSQIPGGILFPIPDDRTWSLGLSASLPLFTGGERKADRLQAEQELESLRLDHESVRDKVEQRIRSAMEIARASRTGIDLSRQAADAAGKNLDLVTDAYARGAVSILELLDAQNAALNAEELATNSIYDFLIDLLEVERAANRIEILGTAETAEAFFKRLEHYFRERGIAPLAPPSG